MRCESLVGKQKEEEEKEEEEKQFALSGRTKLTYDAGQNRRRAA